MAIEREHGRLDLLVNNAGAAWRAPFAEGGWDNVRRNMEINFDAVVRLTDALLALLRASAPSAVVNVASGRRSGRARQGGGYGASTAALASWSDRSISRSAPTGSTSRASHGGRRASGHVHRIASLPPPTEEKPPWKNEDRPPSSPS